jgi:hypothetical protein
MLLRFGFHDSGKPNDRRWINPYNRFILSIKNNDQTIISILAKNKL